MAAPDWSNVDFYAVLGVPVTATSRDITRAFRRCALECHPDTHPDDDAAAARFLDIVAAHDVLGDEVTRREYDLFRRLGVVALARADVLSSGVRGYVYAAPPPRPPVADPVPSRRRRVWLVAGAAAAAVAVGALVISLGHDARRDTATTSSTDGVGAPTIVTDPGESSPFAYSFSDIDCSPHGWSGVFVNGESTPFDGVLSAVAIVDDVVVARSVVDTEVPAGGQELIQFNWQGVPPAAAECRMESVTSS